MDEGDQYDSYLRRVAKGEIQPRMSAIYKIGQGLRAAGLPWCCGALALLRNAGTYNDLLSVVDIASAADSGNVVAFWFVFARSPFELSDSVWSDETATRNLDLLAGATEKIAPLLEAAFREYEKHGLKKSHGYLGDAFLLANDKRFSHADELVQHLQNKWLVENRFDDRFLRRLAAPIEIDSKRAPRKRKVSKVKERE